jgi:CubicO group peptidase (beta-lactamase class C family)
MDSGRVMKVSIEGGRIFIQPTGEPKVEAFAESENSFLVTGLSARLSFQTDKRNVPFELVLHQGERDLVFKRITLPTADTLRAQLSEVDAIVAAHVNRLHIGSASVGVVAGNQLIWAKSYGEADMEKKIPADQNTVYRIGSITKMFTAVMLHQLVDSGKVHLSDTVERYLPEVRSIQRNFPYAPPITLLQLATHTSGLGLEPDNVERYSKEPVADWEKTLIDALPHTRFAFEPGTRFSYSNVGYAILGAALARAAGEPFMEYISEFLVKPLGMNHSGLRTTPEMLLHLSIGYGIGPGGIDTITPAREHIGRGYKVPNGAMYTTVGDLALFASYFMGEGPRTMRSASLERALTQSAIQSDADLISGYGTGFYVHRRDHYISFGHSGEVTGYSAGLYMNRRTEVAVIVLSNADGFGGVAQQALDVLSR